MLSVLVQPLRDSSACSISIVAVVVVVSSSSSRQHHLSSLECDIYIRPGISYPHLVSSMSSTLCHHCSTGHLSPHLSVVHWNSTLYRTGTADNNRTLSAIFVGGPTGQPV